MRDLVVATSVVRPLHSFLRRRWELAVLLVILLLAAGWRFYRLDAQSLWNDEGTSVALAQRDLATITRNAAQDIHPPLYYYLLHYWVYVSGISELGVRSFSALAGVAVVLGVYLLARRLFSPATAILAAWLAALSSFQIYYSQEARMYIFATLFGLLSVLACERVLARFAEAAPGRRFLGAGLAYVLVSILAVYSHYFSFTILLAENLGFLAWLVWRARPPEVARQGSTGRDHFFGKSLLCWVGMQVFIVLCYLPWLWISWRSLRNWPAVSAPLTLYDLLINVSQVFSFGLSVERSMWVRWSSLALLFLVLPGLFCRPQEHRDRSQALPPSLNALLAALYLFVPIATMYLLSLRRPMYKDKFLLLATPAFYLLQAQSLIICGRWLGHLSKTRWVQYLATTVLALILCVASGYSLAGLYLNSQYFRDDYRGIVAYINATAGPDDGILINAPSQIETVNYYYRGPLAEYPLPAQRPLNAAKTEAALQGIIARHPRLYAIFWATAESDPQGVIEGWLDHRCFKALDSWFGNLRLVVYAVPQVAAQEIAHPLSYSLGQEIRLNGYTLLTPKPTSGDILQLTLYWEPRRTITKRLQVFIHLVDGRGNIVGQRDSEPGSGRPMMDWRPGELIADNLGVLVQPGTPPGEHTLRLGLYDPSDGQRLLVTQDGEPVGDAIELGKIAIGAAQAPPPIAALDLQKGDRIRWGALRLLGHSLHRLGYEHERELALRAGDTINLVLFWQKEGAEAGQESFLLEVRDHAGRAILAQPLRITGGMFPVDLWREGEIVRDIQQLHLPTTMLPGTYHLVLRPSDGEMNKPYTLGQIRVQP